MYGLGCQSSYRLIYLKLDGWYDITGGILGFETFFSLVATQGFADWFS